MKWFWPFRKKNDCELRFYTSFRNPANCVEKMKVKNLKEFKKQLLTKPTYTDGHMYVLEVCYKGKYYPVLDLDCYTYNDKKFFSLKALIEQELQGVSFALFCSSMICGNRNYWVIIDKPCKSFESAHAYASQFSLGDSKFQEYSKEYGSYCLRAELRMMKNDFVDTRPKLIFKSGVPNLDKFCDKVVEHFENQKPLWELITFRRQKVKEVSPFPLLAEDPKRFRQGRQSLWLSNSDQEEYVALLKDSKPINVDLKPGDRVIFIGGHEGYWAHYEFISGFIHSMFNEWDHIEYVVYPELAKLSQEMKRYLDQYAMKCPISAWFEERNIIVDPEQLFFVVHADRILDYEDGYMAEDLLCTNSKGIQEIGKLLMQEQTWSEMSQNLLEVT